MEQLDRNRRLGTSGVTSGVWGLVRTGCFPDVRQLWLCCVVGQLRWHRVSEMEHVARGRDIITGEGLAHKPRSERTAQHSQTRHGSMTNRLCSMRGRLHHNSVFACCSTDESSINKSIRRKGPAPMSLGGVPVLPDRHDHPERARLDQRDHGRVTPLHSARHRLRVLVRGSDGCALDGANREGGAHPVSLPIQQ